MSTPDPTTRMPDVTQITDEYMREMIGASKTYTVMLLRLTPEFHELDTDRQIVWEHGRRNFALRAEGLLPIVCPTTDDSDRAGVGIFDAPPEEVSRIMDEDPGVKARIFTYELHPARGIAGSILTWKIE